MWNKYCKRHIPTSVQWKGGSQLGKKMLEVRDEIEKDIWWKCQTWFANIQFENWTGLGPLYQVLPSEFNHDMRFTDLNYFMKDGIRPC